MRRYRGMFPVFTFYGHEVFPFGLFPNVMNGIMAPGLIYLAVSFWLSDVAPKWLVYGYLWFAFMTMPNSMYLFLEIKHIVLKDGIADDRPLPAVIGFSLISLLGLISAIANVLIIVHMVPIAGQHYYLSVVVVSFLSALGGVMGLLDITSLFGFVIPPLAVMFAVKVLIKKSLLLLTICLTALLSLLSIAVNVVYTIGIL